MGKRRDETQCPPAPEGAFTVSVTNDRIFLTVGVPRAFDFPFIGPTRVETVALVAAACATPWLILLGRRTARTVRRLLDQDRRPKDGDRAVEEKAESPVKAKKWESKSKKLEDFMNDEILPARKQLRHVEDPDTVEKRMAKREKIKTEESKNPKGKLGLTPELLQNSRTGLRQAVDAPLASYVNGKREDPQAIDRNIQILEGRLVEDIKASQLAKQSGADKGEEHEDATNDNKCILM